MAIIYSIPKILKQNYNDTYVEENLFIDFLDRNLDDSFEVYHRPQLNGDRPPFVIMKKGYGVMIINISNISIIKFSLQEFSWDYDNIEYSSPFIQAKGFKSNIINLHSDFLLELITENKFVENIISTVVYFTEDTTTIAKSAMDKAIRSGDVGSSLNYVKYFGFDIVNDNKADHIIRLGSLNSKNKLFTNRIYESLKRYLLPSFHSKDEGQQLFFTKKQQSFIDNPLKNRKIRGVVGSGKTYVLAKIAVNEHKRTGNEVLILTFNITLLNYIKESLDRIQEDFYRDNFFINNYHSFFNQQALKVGTRVKSLAPYDDTEFFSCFAEKTQKFDTILIDEIQDYKKEWIENIKKYFLKDNGTFIVFGDEKQNIYNRKIEEDKRPYTGISGNWNRLNESFRSKNSILQLLSRFQSSFMSDKYYLDEIIDGAQTDIFNQADHIKYFTFPKSSQLQHELSSIYTYIKKTIIDYKIHPEDVTVLSNTHKTIRELDFLWRTNMKEHTAITFDKLETHYSVIIQELMSVPVVNQGVDMFNKIPSDLIKAITLYLAFITIGDNKLIAFLDNRNVNLEEFKKWHINFEKTIDFFLFEATSINFKPDNIIKAEEERERKKLASRIKNKLERIMRNNKVHFKHNGLMKFSTIYSYKGWESHTVFLLIEEDQFVGNTSSTVELLYTGMSRAMVNLFVIDSNQSKYTQFFKNNIEQTA